MSVLIVGLGNPGSSYKYTRHNIGWRIVEAFGKKLGWKFKSKTLLRGEVAVGKIADEDIYLLLPTTYMNNSGLAVTQAMKEFNVPRERVLVVTDDIHLPFGSFRFREKGTSGGHNGLKSIEAYLASQEYDRLRVGLGDTFVGRLDEFVLMTFTQDEEVQIPRVITEAEEIVDLWLKRDPNKVKQLASQRHIEGENA